MPRQLFSLVAVAILVATIGFVQAATTDQVLLLEQEIDNAALDPGAAIDASGLKIPMPGGVLDISSGVLIPASPLGSHRMEWVFVGNAELTVEPPSYTEAHQLWLFTSREKLEEQITRAVLVIASGGAVSELVQDRQAQPEANQLKSAVEYWNQWRSGPEFDGLRVRSRLLRVALEPGVYDDYFVARFESESLRTFIVRKHPEERLQVSYQQFVPLEWSLEEKLQRRKTVSKKKGRAFLEHLEFADGYWDIWMMWPRGEPVQDVEPSHYELHARLGKKAEKLTGTARLTLRSMRDAVSSISLVAFDEIQVHACRLGEQNLKWLQEGGDLLVLLENPLQKGESLELEVDYSLTAQVKIRRGLYTQRANFSWYPHAGLEDMATYQVRYEWPSKLELLGSGQVIDHGKEGGTQWQVRELDFRTGGVSFRSGKYDIHKVNTGGIELTVGFSRESRWMSKKDRDHLVKNIRHAFGFAKLACGPYPLDYLTITTTPDDYSQGGLSFITFADLETVWGHAGFTFAQSDYRVTLAHEIAHQWWGNMVTPESIHDAWLSEGIADYIGRLYGSRAIGAMGSKYIDPLAKWKDQLSAVRKGGQPMIRVGPMTLGTRLRSSICTDCYENIIYVKGGKVTEMLSQVIGEDRFLTMLQHLTQAAGGKKLSTEFFFRALSKMAHQDLKWFRERYVDGTAWYNVPYTVKFEFARGEWTVELTVEQEPDYVLTNHFERLPDGKFDIRGKQIILWETDESAFFLPFKITGDDPEEQVHLVRISVSGPKTVIRVPVDFEPKEARLDPDRTSLAFVFPQKNLSQMMRTRRAALTRWRMGAPVEALALLEDAYYASTGGTSVKALAKERLQILLHRCSILMDLNRLDQAAETLAQIHALEIGVRAGSWAYILALDARMAYLKGDTNKAYNMLWKEVLNGENRRFDAYQLLAITALERGETKSFEKAVDWLQWFGIDTSMLEKEMKARQR